MLVVAGTGLKNLNPRAWDLTSPYHLPGLRAIMISYADFFNAPPQREKAMDQGLHAYLGVPHGVRIYLDNGAFFFLGHGSEVPEQEYIEFVERAKPDWWPIPQDIIPTATMALEEQRACFARTMESNLAYQHDGFMPVIHVSRFLNEYTVAVKANEQLAAKPGIALGGMVPNLLRASKAIPYQDILDSLEHVREEFADKHIHVFGLGGTATLHLAALLGIDSVDSSGWRNRAARGIVQLPGSGDRSVAELGSWRGRQPVQMEWERLATCPCPTCRLYGLDGLKAGGTAGFCYRATHNLWTLLDEARQIEEHLAAGTYLDWYITHLDNSIYRPLIEQVAASKLRATSPSSAT